jgi:hypothetical protein
VRVAGRIAIAAGALLVVTASGWTRVDGAEVVEKVSLVAGLSLTLPDPDTAPEATS